MILWAIKTLFSVLVILPAPAGAATLGHEPAREQLVQRLEALRRNAAFAEFKAGGAEILEVAGFETGLYIRYVIDNKECLATLILNADRSMDKFVPDGRCPAHRQGLQSRDPAMDARAAADGMRDLSAMIYAIRYLNRVGSISPPLEKTVAVRREGERVVVTYIPIRGGSPCMVSLYPPAPGRVDSHFWYVSGRAACESR